MLTYPQLVSSIPFGNPDIKEQVVKLYQTCPTFKDVLRTSLPVTIRSLSIQQPPTQAQTVHDVLHTLNHPPDPLLEYALLYLKKKHSTADPVSSNSPSRPNFLPKFKKIFHFFIVNDTKSIVDKVISMLEESITCTSALSYPPSVPIPVASPLYQEVFHCVKEGKVYLKSISKAINFLLFNRSIHWKVVGFGSLLSELEIRKSKLETVLNVTQRFQPQSIDDRIDWEGSRDIEVDWETDLFDDQSEFDEEEVFSFFDSVSEEPLIDTSVTEILEALEFN
ncbi:hypothetical protein P9112_012002 [Eukaryota sp. TZLM1-RC]